MSYFRTKRLHLACYVHAAGVLEFSHAENDINRRAVFVFDDPDRIGAEVERAYDGGALVPAVGFSSSLTYLRRQMTAIENGEQSNVSHVRR